MVNITYFLVIVCNDLQPQITIYYVITISSGDHKTLSGDISINGDYEQLKLFTFLY